MSFSFNFDPEKMFPLHALQEELRKYGIFGVSIAATLLPMLTSDANSCPDLDLLAEHIQNHTNNFNPFAAEKTKDIFDRLRRMRDVIADLDRLGYIWLMFDQHIFAFLIRPMVGNENVSYGSMKL